MDNLEEDLREDLRLEETLRTRKLDLAGRAESTGII